MDNETKNKIDNLERQVKALEKEMQSLKDSSTIPYELKRSFAGAGFLITPPPDVPPYTDWYLNNGFGYNLGGDDYVQAMARSYLKVTDGSRDLFIPLLQLKE